MSVLVCGLVGVGCGGTAPESEPPGIGTAPRQDGTSTERTVIRDDDGEFVASVEEMLRGKVSGVQVVHLPECGGVSLRIRGLPESLSSWDSDSNSAVAQCAREPLLIIDDKPVPLGHMAVALRSLRPADVDRIRVLKDVASTSMYGTRGAHGVVIITTK